MKLKKGDQVLIISGKDRGRKGKILRVLPKDDKIVVENVNLRKKHVRPRKSGEKGQIVEVASLFHGSNAKIICPKCGQTTRTGYKITGEKKYRICKKCNNEI